jgi:hypothetical protein
MSISLTKRARDRTLAEARLALEQHVEDGYLLLDQLRVATEKYGLDTTTRRIETKAAIERYEDMLRRYA